jgi:ribonuclease HI
MGRGVCGINGTHQKAVCEAAVNKTILVEMFTDGSCLRNPGGPGGWGVVLRNGKQKREHFGGERSTTNNRMEMLAVIEGLTMLDIEPTSVRVYTDSRYVMDGISSWIKGWKRKGWVTANGDPVKNKDLWIRMDALVAKHRVEWCWVKGHNGNRGNERADALASQGALRARSSVLKMGHEPEIPVLPALVR